LYKPLSPDRDGFTPYPGVDGESWAVVQARLDTARSTVLPVANISCYLTHRVGSLDASKLPVNAMFNMMGRLVGNMASTDGPGGQVVMRLASNEYLAFSCPDDALFAEVQDHFSPSEGRTDNGREWVVVHYIKLKRQNMTGEQHYDKQCALLKPFKRAMKRLESDKVVTNSAVLPIMYMLRKELEVVLTNPHATEVLRGCVKNSRKPSSNSIQSGATRTTPGTARVHAANLKASHRASLWPRHWIHVLQNVWISFCAARRCEFSLTSLCNCN
jgi:hypothetical protein